MNKREKDHLAAAIAMFPALAEGGDWHCAGVVMHNHLGRQGAILFDRRANNRDGFEQLYVRAKDDGTYQVAAPDEALGKAAAS